MAYSLIKVVNGAYTIHEEGIATIDSAKKKFHTLCAALWNDQTVKNAQAMIADEQLDVVEGYKEYVHHD